MSCWQALEQRQRRCNSLLVLGMDPQPGVADLRAWGQSRIAACAPYCCACKFNLAFFLLRADSGLDDLRYLCACARAHGLSVILDAKFNDVSHSASAYADFAFQRLEADALTVNPLLGADSVAAFARYADKAIFLIAHSSNPGSGVFMGPDYYQRLLAVSADSANVGFVVGANALEALHYFRNHGEPWLLSPGLGAQGADAEPLLASTKRRALLVPLSRGLDADNVQDWAQRLAAQPQPTTITAEVALA